MSSISWFSVCRSSEDPSTWFDDAHHPEFVEGSVGMTLDFTHVFFDEFSEVHGFRSFSLWLFVRGMRRFWGDKKVACFL